MAADDYSLQSLWNAAAGIGADQSYVQPRTSETVPTNALTSMQPVQETGGEWGAFWQNTIGSLVSYSLAKDAAKNGVTQYGSAAPGYTPTTTVAVGNPAGNLGIIALAVAAVVLVAVVMHKG